MEHGPLTRPPAEPSSQARAGLCYGVGAYLWWGLCPLYFRQVKAVPADVVLAHRIVWSILLLALLLGVLGQWREVLELRRRPRVIGALAISATLLAINWLVFIYAVGHGRAVEASLGYFINPLVTVVLGMVFLGERLGRAQWAAVGIAAIGVAWFAWVAVVRGGTPWIAMALPASFGLYSLIRKRIPAGPLVGLFVETGLLMPLGAVYLAIAHTGPAAGSLNRAGVLGLLALSGIVTTVPMLSFVAAARRLPLVTVGFLQYINPTLQFLLAVLVFREAFDAAKAASFATIWAALAVFLTDAVRGARERPGD